MNGCFDEAREEEYEQDEGHEHDDAGKELPLLDQAEDYGEEEEGYGGCGDAVWEYPVERVLAGSLLVYFRRSW